MRTLVHKTCIVLSMLCIVVYCMADTHPSTYYASANGQHDAILKDSLHAIIRGGERVHYGTHGNSWPEGKYYCGTWNYFPITDIRSDGSVWDMYSNTVRYYPTIIGESGCALNIEHCFPKSWWGGDENDAYKDLYHLNPSDAQANQTGKNSYPPGMVDSLVKFDNGTFKQGYMKGHKFRVFEPADVYKGDFARAYFYIATAYGDLSWASAANEYLDNTSYLEFRPWLIEVLLSWHRSDPVSQKEIERMKVIFTAQNNRNPYIDYPDLVEYIWGNKKGQVVNFATLLCTLDDDYTPLEDKTNFQCYPAQLLEDGRYNIRWSDFEETYTLELYTRSIVGSNDTLVSLPGITSKLLTATAYGAVEGKIQSNGTQAITMGSGSTDGTVVLNNLQLQGAYTLMFRASQYNTANAAQLDVYADQQLIGSFNDITRDEQIYTCTIPSGTQTIRITSVGGSTKKRACMQSLYLYKGNYTEQITPIMQPIVATGNESNVHIPESFSGKTIYYRVKRSNGEYSNELSLVKQSVSTGDVAEKMQQATVQKIVIDGHIYIQSTKGTYTLLGTRNDIR